MLHPSGNYNKMRILSTTKQMLELIYIHQCIDHSMACFEIISLSTSENNLLYGGFYFKCNY
jgi:hypothetical protein